MSRAPPGSEGDAEAVQPVEVLVKWGELPYDEATWEQLPDIEGLPGAPAALLRLRSLRPISQTVPASASCLPIVRKRSRLWAFYSCSQPCSIVCPNSRTNHRLDCI